VIRVIRGANRLKRSPVPCSSSQQMRFYFVLFGMINLSGGRRGRGTEADGRLGGGFNLNGKGTFLMANEFCLLLCRSCWRFGMLCGQYPVHWLFAHVFHFNLQFAFRFAVCSLFVHLFALHLPCLLFPSLPSLRFDLFSLLT